MRIRIFNAKILTMEPGAEIMDGELWVEHGYITAVGTPSLEQKSHPPTFASEINAHGNLLLPGFKNAHAHSPMTFLRSFADDLPLLEWLEEQVFPMEEKLTEEQAYHFAKLAILEYLSSGITSSFEMYIYPHAIVKASLDSGFRTVLCGAINDFTSSPEELEQDYLKYQDYHSLISMKLGFHAEYTTSDESIRDIAALSKKYKAPVYTHLSESKDEVEQCLERTGKTPPQHLNDLGIWEYGGGGYHCIHMSPEDLDLFQQKGLFAVTNPGSNVKLASGIAPLEEMRQRGIPLALGTDGAASNNALDMFREMHLTTVLQKLDNNDAAAFPADTVLHMASAGGAAAMGLDNADTLSVGKKADIVMLDLSQPNMQPEHNTIKNIVYSGSKSNVLMTMVNGNILYQEGHYYIGQHPQDIYRNCRNIIANLLAN